MQTLWYAGFVKLSMKEKFDVYLLWPFGKKLILATLQYIWNKKSKSYSDVRYSPPKFFCECTFPLVIKRATLNRPISTRNEPNFFGRGGLSWNSWKRQGSHQNKWRPSFITKMWHKIFQFFLFFRQTKRQRWGNSKMPVDKVLTTHYGRFPVDSFQV